MQVYVCDKTRKTVDFENSFADMAHQSPTPPVRLMRDYLNPARVVPPSPIASPTPTANNVAYTIKPNALPMLPSFYGMEPQNPYDHVREFEDIVDTIVTNTAKLQSAHMKLFPYSLKDKARTWLASLKPLSITTWDEMENEFFKKLFPLYKTVGLKSVFKFY